MKLFRTYLIRLSFFAALTGLVLFSTTASSAVAPQANFLGRITQGIKTPVRMATDPFGNVFVADPRGGGILKYTNSGHLVSSIPVKGPRGVVVTLAGDLVVSRGDSVSVLDSATGLEKFKLGAGGGQFKQATGVAVDDAGQIYVVDSLDNCVQVFNISGAPVPIAAAAPGKPANSFGTGGSQTGQLSLPTGITFEKLSRQLAVVDTLNGRVQLFSRSGTFQRSLGSPGGGPLQFSSPRAVAFEYTKAASPSLLRIYVVDSFQSEVQVIDPAGSGSFLSTIGGYGLSPGKLVTPADILFDQTTSHLIVANGLGDLTLFGINVTTPQTPDITPPVITLNQVPTTTSTGSVILSGTVESEATISIITNTGAIAGPVNFAQQSPTSNFWTATVTGLASGTNIITVIAKDEAENSTGLNAIITYDPAAVKLTINPVVSPTNSSSQTITGTMDAGATITLTASTSAIFGQVTNPTSTTWQSTISGLATGNNTITATAASQASTSSVAAIIALVIVPPDLNVSTLVNGNGSSSPLLNVSGFVPDNGFFDRVTINGKPVPVLNDFFSTLLILSAGDNVITVQAFDKAGNVATDTRFLTYSPLRPSITVTSPADGATVNSSLLNLNGSAPARSTVTLSLYNGSAAGTQFFQITQPGSSTSWSTTQPLPLDPGLNTIIAAVTDQNGATAQTKVTINSNARVPALAINSPPRDLAVNTAAQTLSGATSSGDTVSANIGNIVLPVNLDSNGTFTIPVALMSEGIYQIAVTATDPLGNAVTTFRSLLFDTTSPRLTVNSTNPLRVTVSDGIFTVRDKNGPIIGGVVTVNADGSSTLDLTNVNFDTATLDIHTVDAAGNNSRNGDLDGNGTIDIVDAMLALRIAIGLDAATAEILLRADVAPLVNGIPAPDGIIDIFDIVYIMEKIVGLH